MQVVAASSPRWNVDATAYVLVLGLLNLPSMLLWTAPTWNLATNEYDWFLGQPWAEQWLGRSALGIGRGLHSALFLVAGLLFARLCWPWLNGRETPGWAAVMWTTGGAMAVSLAGLPWVSPDVFYYLGKGWLAVGYGMNPYQHEIIEAAHYATDPLLQNVPPIFANHNVDYGPLFQPISQFPVWVGNGDPKISLFIFKLMMAAAVVTTGWAACQMARVIGDQSSPARLAAFATVANPVSLFALVTCAHNDALIALAMALALWALVTARPAAAGVFLAGGFSVKYIPLLLLPVLALAAYALAQKRAEGSGRQAGVTFLAAFGLAAIFFHLPYLDSWSNLGDLIGSGFHLYRNNHVFFPAAASLDWTLQWHHVWMNGMRGLFVLLYSALLWMWWQRRATTNREHVVKQGLLVLVAYLLIGSIAIHEWYLCWFLPLAFALGQPALWRTMLMLVAVFPGAVIWTLTRDRYLDLGVNLLLYAFCLGLALWYYYQRRAPRQGEAAKPPREMSPNA